MSITIPGDAAPGLFLHRSADTAALARSLAETLAEPLADPFATELVCVPTPGVERWLSQTLAGRLGATGLGDGVSAGIDFVRLEVLVRRTIEEVLGIEPATDPWHPDRGTWALLRVLDDCVDEPWATPIRAQLDPRLPGSRRYATAARLFGLFQSYAAQRPQLLDRWRAGEAVDAAGSPLDEYARWQARLWFALRTELGGPDPAERIARAATILSDRPTATGVPGRLSVFGPTRLASDQTRFLAALARHRRVHLWLPHPSPVLWERVAHTLEQHPDDEGPGPRLTDPTAIVPRHRLNRRLARDARELQVALATCAPVDLTEPETVEAASDRVLHRLQAALRGDVEQPERAVVAADDDSVRIHVSHGPDRQAEVLREVVLGLLADHPDLEPRDLVVMCPDIETFAPLIAAAFALDGVPGAAAHPGHALHVRLADRALRELNPLLGTLQTLLDLGESRAGMSELLDLCADPPVARRFGFTDKDLERLRTLVPRSGVRWGLDLEHRTRHRMSRFPQNTWRAGVERMLLGIALDESDHRVQGTVLPLADIESSDAALVGRLAELLDRLTRIVESFTTAQTLPDWVAACRSALESVTEVGPGDGWQLTHAWGELSALAESADPAGAETGAERAEVLLTPADMRAVLADAFAGRPSRANFRTGALTLCTMAPMRSVPHRAVILLGLDDGVFPRRARVDGDDLLALAPWVGDRDRRSEDRQQLLDAVLAARDHLVVIHCGASPQTGEPRPPAVPVVELRAALAEVCAGDPWPMLERRHSLQPFSPTNFTPDADGVAFSFDPVACRAAEALQRGRLVPASAAVQVPARDLPPLPEFAEETVAVGLADLGKFFANPATALLRRRAQLYLPDEAEPAQADEIPIELDPLAEWALGERLLQAHAAGADLGALVTAEYCRGDVPPMARGRAVLDKVAQRVAATTRAAQTWLQLPPDSRWLAFDLGRWRVSGPVAGLRERTVVRLSYSQLSGKQRLASWLDLLALKVAHPEVEWRAVTIGRSGSISVLGPIAEADARARLNELIILWARGAQELIPLPPKTAWTLVDGDRAGGDNRVLQSTWKREHGPAWHHLGIRDDLPSLYSIPPTPGEERGRQSGFEVLARRVFGPLLEAERPL